LKVLVLTIILLLINPINSFAGIGRIAEQSGPAEIQRNKQSSPSAINSDIETMDTVVTAKAKLGIIFEDNTKVNITEQSKLVIDDFVYDAKKTTGKLALKVALGTVRYASGQIAKHDPQNVGIQTPTATVAVRGTDFSMTVDELGKSTIILLPSCDITGCVTGAIEVSTDAGFVLMNQAFQTTVVSDKNSAPTKPVIISIDAANIDNTLIVSPPVKSTDNSTKVEQIKTDLDINFLDQDFLSYKQLDLNVLDLSSELDKNYLEVALMEDMLNATNQVGSDLLAVGVMLPGYNEASNLKYYINSIEQLVLNKSSKHQFELKIDKNSDATLNLNQEGVPLSQRINMGIATKITIIQK
jgi:hypothetical protein